MSVAGNRCTCCSSFQAPQQLTWRHDSSLQPVPLLCVCVLNRVCVSNTRCCSCSCSKSSSSLLFDLAARFRVLWSAQNDLHERCRHRELFQQHGQCETQPPPRRRGGEFRDLVRAGYCRVVILWYFLPEIQRTKYDKTAVVRPCCCCCCLSSTIWHSTAVSAI